MASPDAEPLPLYRVKKFCIKEGCGLIWEGSSFVPHPPEAEPLPGICANCNDADDVKARIAASDRRRFESAIEPDLELQPPKMTADR